MPDAISPEALPGWPYKDVKTEKVTLLACLLGKHVTRRQDEVNEQPLRGVFGDVMLLWELLRHDRELVELLAKQRTPPTKDDWKSDPVYTTVFTSEIGFIVSTPGFPDTPFLAIEEKDRAKLVELYTGGQPAFEIADIEKLDAMGVLERFKQLATLALKCCSDGSRERPALHVSAGT
jgi:hypothetical protein